MQPSFTSLLASALTAIALNVTIIMTVILSLLLGYGYHYSVWQIALLNLPMPMVMIITARLAGSEIIILGAQEFLLVGLTLMLVSLLCLTQLQKDWPLPVIVSLLCVYGAGVGLVQVLNGCALCALVSRKHMTSAAIIIRVVKISALILGGTIAILYLIWHGLLAGVRDGWWVAAAFVAVSLVALALEALSVLKPFTKEIAIKWRKPDKDLCFARSCYDHLAGELGVQITGIFLEKNYLVKEEKQFVVTDEGHAFFLQMNINCQQLLQARRPLARPCLDWTERRYHLAGQLGKALLDRFLAQHIVIRAKHGRALYLTEYGKKQLAIWMMSTQVKPQKIAVF